MEQNQQSAIEVRKQKFLVTFSHPGIFISVGGSTVHTGCAICEFDLPVKDGTSRIDTGDKSRFTVVGLADNRKLDKAQVVHGGYSLIAAMVEYDE